MRTMSRGVSIASLPPEWELHCRQSFAVDIREIRTERRSWWRAYVELIEEGFIRCPGTDAERRQARSMKCRCGWEMSVRAFELIGDEAELVARRTYALCVRCGEWAEI